MFSAAIIAIGLAVLLTFELSPAHAQSTEPNSCNVQAYNIPGTYTYTVPQGVTSINVTMWGGAGGGGGSQSGTYFYDSRWGQYYYSFGGAGGYSAGTISVTPGEKLTITVGGGGVACDLPSLYEPQGYCSGGWGGGGRGGISASDGSGGGMSAIAEGSAPLIIAGGGGGGSQGGSASGFTRYQGGAGGGLEGNNASIYSGAGYRGMVLAQGGTQTSGGAGGGPYPSQAGSQYKGGDPQAVSCGVTGGGGGSGYYGGGSGGASDWGCFAGHQTSGAGGSGYIAPSVQNGATVAGQNGTPPETSSPYYIPGTAAGGTPAPPGAALAANHAGDGLVILAGPNVGNCASAPICSENLIRIPTAQSRYSGPLKTHQYIS